MSYEDAPATKMLATHCAICRRPLCDAKSVEIGIGPVCRKRYGYDRDDIDEETRAKANKVIYGVAINGHGDPKLVVDACKKLFDLGLSGVMAAILKTAAKVKLSVTDDTHPHGPGRYALKTEWIKGDGREGHAARVKLLRKTPGMRWDGEHKVWTFPASSRKRLFAALVEAYPGVAAIGPKGPFVVETLTPKKSYEPAEESAEARALCERGHPPGSYPEPCSNPGCSTCEKCKAFDAYDFPGDGNRPIASAFLTEEDKEPLPDPEPTPEPPVGSYAATARMMASAWPAPDGDPNYWDKWKEARKAEMH